MEVVDGLRRISEEREARGRGQRLQDSRDEGGAFGNQVLQLVNEHMAEAGEERLRLAVCAHQGRGGANAVVVAGTGPRVVRSRFSEQAGGERVEGVDVGVAAAAGASAKRRRNLADRGPGEAEHQQFSAGLEVVAVDQYGEAGGEDKVLPVPGPAVTTIRSVQGASMMERCSSVGTAREGVSWDASMEVMRGSRDTQIGGKRALRRTAADYRRH